MRNKSKNNDNPPQPPDINMLREAQEKFKRGLAAYLSTLVNTLSPRYRKLVLIGAGLMIAILCFKLVFAPGEFNVSFGAIRPSITTPYLPDSTNTGADSLIQSNN